ncbi:MAG: sigma-54-dependent transcriptional regulator [Gemmataceae bacterium]
MDDPRITVNGGEADSSLPPADDPVVDVSTMVAASGPDGEAEVPAQLAPADSPLRRILIADDSDKACRHLQELLGSEQNTLVDACRNGDAALEALTDPERNYSIFLTDLKMPGLDGMQLIEEVQKRNLPVTTIVMTGFGSIEQAVQAMRMGAYDFLTKPIDPEHLRLVVRRALRERHLQDEVLALRARIQDRYSFHNIISKSERMHAVFELIANVAHTTTTVLIEGETGTGKELVARAIHEASAAARSGPFVAINCAALPENLLESELFGHEKGAFTGAVQLRQGRFEMADGGTIFLDEVGELPPSLQVKLLRVLQERSFERVGGSKTIHVDVRVITATNRSLAGMVKRKRFRKDLYYRVNVVRMRLPPLRKRPEDIPLLATHFAAKYAVEGEPVRKISPEAMEILLNHHWPGNVRQLENVIERAAVIARGDTIEPQHLAREVSRRRKPKSAEVAPNVDTAQPLPDLLRNVTSSVEEEYIRKVLAQCGGNVTESAKVCGLSRRSLTAKIAEYQIDRRALRGRPRE